jgi:minimal PKS acyl carrier protein
MCATNAPRATPYLFSTKDDHMTSFTLPDLIHLINEVSEQDAASDISLSVEDADRTFDDLGLDSLAVLSVIAQIEKQLAISIGLDAGTAAATPNGLLALVIGRIGPSTLVA